MSTAIMPREHNTILSIRFIFFWLLAILLETPLLYSFFDPSFYATADSNLKQLLSLHILSAIAMFISYPKSESWFHYSRNWAVFFALIVLFLPVFGHVISLFTFLFCTNNPNTALLFEEDAVFLSRNKYKLMLQDIQSTNWYDRAHHAVDFMPLVDILDGSNIALKRSAIDRIIEMPPNEATALLKIHSRDKSPEIRFHITSALAKIKKQLEDDIGAAKQQFQSEQTNTNYRLNLAKSYLRYCESGILDLSGVEIYLLDVLSHLKHIIQQTTSSIEVHKLLIEVYIRHCLWQNALDHLKRIESESILTRIEWLKFSALCQYNLRNYPEMQLLLAQMSNQDSSDWSATINWLGVTS